MQTSFLFSQFPIFDHASQRINAKVSPLTAIAFSLLVNFCVIKLANIFTFVDRAMLSGLDNLGLSRVILPEQLWHQRVQFGVVFRFFQSFVNLVFIFLFSAA